MNKIFRISFSLKSTYRVNSILYSIKQIPLIKRIIPDVFYSIEVLKTFGKILSILWEIGTLILGKLLYFVIMLAIPINGFHVQDKGAVFLYILALLTIIGAVINSFMFNPTKDKFYAIILMRIDARKYTLANYGYELLKVFIGFSIFGILFGLQYKLPLWHCILIPLFVLGIKIWSAAFYLARYEGTGIVNNENQLGAPKWILMLLVLALAYILPALGVVVPANLTTAFMIGFVVVGAFSVPRIIHFRYYREVYREMFAQMDHQLDAKKVSAEIQRDNSRRAISADTDIVSKRKGFEYLNELFIKRHQQILWKATKKVTVMCSVLVLVAVAGLYWIPEEKELINELILSFLPSFVMVMYAINRGAGFTGALFTNCDHSLLTYSFYKQPKFILELFQIRLREIIKINLPPAVVIGVGLALLLWLSGGADTPLHYVVLMVSICSLSIFFSVHHLTIYYLLQPYNAETEIKSGMYQIVNTGTYFLCFYVMYKDAPLLLFGSMTILFCVLYCIVASVLVYFLAPKTFRIRN